jgi:nucleoside-diphosphate-sugar epimerase
MNILVTAAAGAIGRRLLPILLEASHEVTGMIRPAERARAIQDARARAVVCDDFDALG